jgi:plasmid stability protein
MRYNAFMKTTLKRATLYLDTDIHKALRVKAAETDRTLSDLVNEAVKQSLAEDNEDLAAFEERATEPNLSFERVLKDLKRRGKI